ncbi:hypothetical protein ACFXA0_11890 [Streptomyces cyaneofuscatus]|uniref:hypothetical protein n=1 Tax=Streptomyces cyaneofuscatus TaxID=66883 RepID=UPI0036AF408F
MVAGDIIACVEDPDIPTCLWAIVTALPIGKAAKIAGSIPKISKAIWGIGAFLDKSAKARKLVDKSEEILDAAWKKLPACVTDKKKKSASVARSSALISAPATAGAFLAFARAGGGHDPDGVGLKREEFIAKLVGGTVAKDDKGQDIPIVMPNVGKSGLDVIGPNGEYIFGGGGAKARDRPKSGRALQIAKYAADQAGVKAIYYLADNTPGTAVDQAKKVFGEENVHIFTLPGC